MVALCAKIEAELADLTTRTSWPSWPTLGLAGRARLNRLIRAGYQPRPADLLHRCQGSPRLTIHVGDTAPRRLAGVIHTDFERGFIRAQTIASKTSSY